MAQASARVVSDSDEDSENEAPRACIQQKVSADPQDSDSDETPVKAKPVKPQPEASSDSESDEPPVAATPVKLAQPKVRTSRDLDSDQATTSARSAKVEAKDADIRKDASDSDSDEPPARTTTTPVKSAQPEARNADCRKVASDSESDEPPARTTSMPMKSAQPEARNADIKKTASDSESDEPPSRATSMPQKCEPEARKADIRKDSSDSESDEPSATTTPVKSAQPESRSAEIRKASSDSENDERPTKTKSIPAKSAQPVANRADSKQESRDSDSDEPPAKTTPEKSAKMRKENAKGQHVEPDVSSDESDAEPQQKRPCSLFALAKVSASDSEDDSPARISPAKAQTNGDTQAESLLSSAAVQKVLEPTNARGARDLDVPVPKAKAEQPSRELKNKQDIVSEKSSDESDKEKKPTATACRHKKTKESDDSSSSRLRTMPPKAKRNPKAKAKQAAKNVLQDARGAARHDGKDHDGDTECTRRPKLSKESAAPKSAAQLDNKKKRADGKDVVNESRPDHKREKVCASSPGLEKESTPRIGKESAKKSKDLQSKLSKTNPMVDSDDVKAVEKLEVKERKTESRGKTRFNKEISQLESEDDTGKSKQASIAPQVAKKKKNGVALSDAVIESTPKAQSDVPAGCGKQKLPAHAENPKADFKGVERREMDDDSDSKMYVKKSVIVTAEKKIDNRYNEKKVYVSGFPEEIPVDVDSLRMSFQKEFGVIEKVFVPVNSCGVAYVDFKSKAAAQAALEKGIDTNIVPGRSLSIARVKKAGDRLSEVDVWAYTSQLDAAQALDARFLDALVRAEIAHDYATLKTLTMKLLERAIRAETVQVDKDPDMQDRKREIVEHNNESVKKKIKRDVK